MTQQPEQQSKQAQQQAKPQSQPRARAAQPPETLEGWYALHQMFAVDWGRLRADQAHGLFAAAPGTA